MKPIEKIFIDSPGSPLEGMPAASYTISGNIIIDPDCVADEDREEYLSDQKELLRKTFAELLDDGAVSVIFDYEIEEEHREIEKYIADNNITPIPDGPWSGSDLIKDAGGNEQEG